MNSETKICQNCKNQFTIEPEDFQFYEKIKVPAPTWCPECRMKRRFIWRNERAMYKRKCDATGKEIFSMFHPDAPVKVYERDYWWSDSWDAIDYGREYDFSKPFFEQFKNLLSEVPLFSRSVNENVRSDYSMNSGWLKDCYLVFNAAYDENCLYSIDLLQSKDSTDLFFCSFCELSYDSYGCTNCYKVFYSVRCRDSQDLYFSRDCVNCSNCFGCVNLRNKQYYIFNAPYSRNEYFKKLEEFNLSSYAKRAKVKEGFLKFSSLFPVKYSQGTHNVNVSGDSITNSKNARDCFYVDGLEDSRYCQFILTPPGSRDCYDFTVFGSNSELVYENCQSGIDISRVRFSTYMYPALRECDYSVMCASSSNLFGCVGLKKKQYCILNKQYTEEQYKQLIPKIVKHMNEVAYKDLHGHEYRYGEFFPQEFSPFAYNETLLKDFFPISRIEADKKGYTWRDPLKKEYKITISSDELPDDIAMVNEDITKEVIECGHKGSCAENCATAFKIIPQEFSFYKNFKIPLPRLCFFCRHVARFKYRNPLKLWHRACQCNGEESENPPSPPAGGYGRAGRKEDSPVYKNTVTHFHDTEHCPNEFETSYAPERPEIVYCESCYNSEVA